MFVCHDNLTTTKKKKPNILRRKPDFIMSSSHIHKPESQNVKSVRTSSFVLDPKSNTLQEQTSIECADFSVDNLVLGDKVTPGVCNTQQQGQNNKEQKSIVYVNTSQQNRHYKIAIQPQNIKVSKNKTVKVEPILIDEMNRNGAFFEKDLYNNQQQIDNEVKHEWCLNLIQDSDTIIIKHISETAQGMIGYIEPPEDPMNLHSDRPSVQESTVVHGEILAPESNSHISPQTQLVRISTMFMCYIPECDEEFPTKKKLNQHIMSVHSNDKHVKPQRHVTIECPVKQVQQDGIEKPCARTFPSRELLMKHLNEDHTIEEAQYRCSECSRRFFWASGLRAHERAHSAPRAQLTCGWPGCGRSFRQPCRLREHARAHTGDRPYPCNFPNCGWSFRTASKLLRHARRHTGERRHACAACGRAFLRREHLRDHAMRHVAPKRRAKHACPSEHCEQSFPSMSSLYAHMKKVHKDEEGTSPAAESTTDAQRISSAKPENMFMVSLLQPSEPAEAGQATAAEAALPEMTEVEEVEVEVEGGHSARTHCTWPLPTRALHYQPADAFVLEEHVSQVEQSEGSESNIYTVKSDLFLHGNMLHNEDSEQMAQCAHGAAGEGEGEGEAEAGDAARGDVLALDADLLLDAPSVHLDQEELYTDAVDESSFRVFLLSGEELT